jgi:hypothetical protein
MKVEQLIFHMIKISHYVRTGNKTIMVNSLKNCVLFVKIGMRRIHVSAKKLDSHFVFLLKGTE